MASKKQLDQKYSPLLVQRGDIENHWRLLITELSAILPEDGASYTIDSSTYRGIVGDLFSNSFRSMKAIRERGQITSVVPLLHEDHADFSYWLGYHQSWRANPVPRLRQLMYNTTGITVYFGDPNNEEKVHLFRAEWPGVRAQRSGKDEIFVFEAPGAGHPHWQFDAYQTRSIQVEEERQRLTDISRVLKDARLELEDFGDVVMSELVSMEEVRRHVCMQRLTGVHFASNAEWASKRWNGDAAETQSHTRGPMNTTEILNWTVSSIIYIQRELSRSLLKGL